MKNLIAILLALAFTLISCGARKVNKSNTEESTKIESVVTDKTKIESETNVTKKVVEVIDNKDETMTEVTTYTPIDNTKPANIIDEHGNKQSINNTIYRNEKVTKKGNTLTTNTSNIGSSGKKIISIDMIDSIIKDTKLKAKEVAIDRKAFNPLFLLLLLIPIGLIAFFYSRIKNAWWV